MSKNTHKKIIKNILQKYKLNQQQKHMLIEIEELWSSPKLYMKMYDEKYENLDHDSIKYESNIDFDEINVEIIKKGEFSTKNASLKQVLYALSIFAEESGFDLISLMLLEMVINEKNKDAK